MAISSFLNSTSIEESPLLVEVVDGVIDYEGRSVLRSKSGGRRSAAFIIGKFINLYIYIHMHVVNIEWKIESLL